MEDNGFPKIASNSNKNPHLLLNRGSHKDSQYWLDNWVIKEELILYNKDNIKNIMTSTFKEELWSDKELEEKRKLRYYKEVINPNLKN